MQNKDVAKIHKYWSRKPGHVVEKFIDKYSVPGDLVFDPFCGSGSIGIEALAKSRSFIGQDLNPFAIFLTENSLRSNFNLEIFHKELNSLKEALHEKVMKLYSYDDAYILFCNQGKKSRTNFNVMLCDRNFNNRRRAKIEEHRIADSRTLDEFHQLKYPDRPFPKKFYKDRFSYKGISKVSDLFTRRNLVALALILDEIKKSNFKNNDLFLLALTNTLLHVSKLKSEDIRPLGVNNYWIPDDHIEENVLFRFLDRANNVGLAKLAIQQKFTSSQEDFVETHYQLYVDSSIEMPHILDESIDYIFTDPPYGDVIQYSELSYVWNTWLEFEYQIEPELIVNPEQNKDTQYFLNQLSKFFAEAHRVLKENSYFTLSFQNKDVNLWFKVAKLAFEQGFSFQQFDAYDYKGSPFNKNWSTNSPKMDFYLTLSKRGKAEMLKIDKAEIDLMASIDREKYRSKMDLFRAYVEFGVIKIFEGFNVSMPSKKELKAFFDLGENKKIQDNEKDQNLRLF